MNWTYQEIKSRSFAIAGILCFTLFPFLPEQEFFKKVEFPIIWAMKKLTRAAIPNPNASLDGKKHSFPFHLRSSFCKTKNPYQKKERTLYNKRGNFQSLNFTLFLFNSAAIHEKKETRPKKMEMMRRRKIAENLHLGGGFSMVGLLTYCGFWNEETWREREEGWIRKNKAWKLLKEQKKLP